jgi:hypothetical protein
MPERRIAELEAASATAAARPGTRTRIVSKNASSRAARVRRLGQSGP